jgi:hypothetical protein
LLGEIGTALWLLIMGGDPANKAAPAAAPSG